MKHRETTQSKSVILKIKLMAICITILAYPETMGYADNSLNANTGSSVNSTIGNQNYAATSNGVAINGGATDSNISNNQNSLSTGNNVNYNTSQPVVISPSSGGSSALVLPRNPLSLPNANLGRSNFGLQFGVQNNPLIGNLATGSSNALGWFAQGGFTIPFGKIPEAYKTQQINPFDEIHQLNADRERSLFGQAVPNNDRRSVSGKVASLNAYNYSTVASGKIALPTPGTVEDYADDTESKPFSARLLALAPGVVFTSPLNTGEKAGIIEVGKEYPYLGHIGPVENQPGWIKILLPNGNQGWTSTKFVFIKNDYTAIDSLAVGLPSSAKTAHKAAKKLNIAAVSSR